MHRGALVGIVVAAGLVGLLAHSPSVAADQVGKADWRLWLIQEQRAFLEQTRSSALAIDQRVVGTGPAADASVSLTGTVNSDGSLLVDLSLPVASTEMTILCVDIVHCWIRMTLGGSDRLWHRIPAHEVSSLRRPLPTQRMDIPEEATYAIQNDQGSVDLAMDDVTIRDQVSFANGAYRETLTVSDASEGMTMTFDKTLTPTPPAAVKAPRASVTGPPMTLDLIPQLP